MAGRAEDGQVGDVVRAALGDAHDVITLPATRLEDCLAALALAMSPLEGVLPVPGVLRILVGLAVRVPGVPKSLIDLGLVDGAIVALARTTTHETRARPARSRQVSLAARGTIWSAPSTHHARLGAGLHARPSQSAQVAASEPTLGKNGRPHESHTRRRRFSWRSLVSFRSRATSSICTSRREMS